MREREKRKSVFWLVPVWVSVCVCAYAYERERERGLDRSTRSDCKNV